VINTYRFFHWNINAANHRDFVERLWMGSLTEAPTVRRYMEEVAERAYKAYGDYIRTTNSVTFVNDMIKVGYLKIDRCETN
jgi:hypothetical protein